MAEKPQQSYLTATVAGIQNRRRERRQRQDSVVDPMQSAGDMDRMQNIDVGGDFSSASDPGVGGILATAASGGGGGGRIPVRTAAGSNAATTATTQTAKGGNCVRMPDGSVVCGGSSGGFPVETAVSQPMQQFSAPVAVESPEQGETRADFHRRRQRYHAAQAESNVYSPQVREYHVRMSQQEAIQAQAADTNNRMDDVTDFNMWVEQQTIADAGRIVDATIAEKTATTAEINQRTQEARDTAPLRADKLRADTDLVRSEAELTRERTLPQVQENLAQARLALIRPDNPMGLAEYASTYATAIGNARQPVPKAGTPQEATQVDENLVNDGLLDGMSVLAAHMVNGIEGLNAYTAQTGLLESNEEREAAIDSHMSGIARNINSFFRTDKDGNASDRDKEQFLVAFRQRVAASIATSLREDPANVAMGEENIRQREQSILAESYIRADSYVNGLRRYLYSESSGSSTGTVSRAPRTQDSNDTLPETQPMMLMPWEW